MHPPLYNQQTALDAQDKLAEEAQNNLSSRHASWKWVHLHNLDHLLALLPVNALVRTLEDIVG